MARVIERMIRKVISAANTRAIAASTIENVLLVLTCRGICAPIVASSLAIWVRSVTNRSPSSLETLALLTLMSLTPCAIAVLWAADERLLMFFSSAYILLVQAS